MQEQDNVGVAAGFVNGDTPGQDLQEFAGSTLVPETGLFADGPYPGGEMALARLYQVGEHGEPVRAVSGLCLGDAGTGKSRWLEHKALEHMLSGLFLVWLIDGAGGASMPGLLDHVDWPAVRPGEWKKVLTAARRLQFHRARKQAARRTGGWPATPDEPFIQIIIDQADQVLRSPVIVWLVTVLLREAEKTGIGVDLATRAPLTEFGDPAGTSGAHVIRGLAMAGNIAVFRSAAPGYADAGPCALPQRPGVHYLAGAAARHEPVQGIRAADPGAWARSAPLLHLPADEARACDADTDDYGARWERFNGRVGQKAGR